MRRNFDDDPFPSHYVWTDHRGHVQSRNYVCIKFDRGSLEVTEHGLAKIKLVRASTDFWQSKRTVQIPPSDTLDAIMAAVTAGPDGRQAALSIALDYLRDKEDVTAVVAQR